MEYVDFCRLETTQCGSEIGDCLVAFRCGEGVDDILPALVKVAQLCAFTVGHDDKEYHDIKGADHYYIERPDLLPDAVGKCSDWLGRKGLA